MSIPFVFLLIVSDWTRSGLLFMGSVINNELCFWFFVSCRGKVEGASATGEEGLAETVNYSFDLIAISGTIFSEKGLGDVRMPSLDHTTHRSLDVPLRSR